MSKTIFGAKPYFGRKKQTEQFLKDIRKVLESGILTQGTFTEQFERSMADITGSKYALAVSSGGAALELVLNSLDLNGLEVIVPTDTFVATANAVIRAGGKPVFADIDEETLCLDPTSLSKHLSSKTVGVIYVHMFGLIPSSFKIIQEFCDENNLFLIEDAAHSHGAKFNGKSAGNLGTAGCFSFYATKVLTTGEGGMVTTDNKHLYDSVKSLRNHGRANDSILYDKVSNNFRMPEISCLLGLQQISILDENIKRRRKIASQYCSKLSGVLGLRLLKGYYNNKDCSYWRFPLYLTGKIDRLELQKNMMENQKIRITWMYDPLCHMQPVFRKFIDESDELLVSEKCMSRLICLPCYPGLENDDISRICSALEIEVKKLIGN